MSLPEILDLGFKIDESKLWAIDIPIEEIFLSDINHNLDIPYLEQEGTDDWNLTPRMLIAKLEKEISHAKKMYEADMKYPIEIFLHRDTWIILDGVHRFTKAVCLGHTTIKVRKVSYEIAYMTRKSDEEYSIWKGKKLLFIHCSLMSLFSRLALWKRRHEKSFRTLNTISVSRDAILANFDLLTRLCPDGYVFPVLKSNAYGHGIEEVASILRDRVTPYVCVDSYYEALRVRRVYSGRILIIGYTLPTNYPSMNLSSIATVVYDIDTIHVLGRLGRRVSIHLKVDTGMARQGIFVEDVPDFLAVFAHYPCLHLEGVCTHLADADALEDDYSRMQVERFDRAISMVRQAGYDPEYIHLANSPASAKLNTILHDTNHLSRISVRSGIALYGVNPLSPDDPNHTRLQGLRLALRLESTLTLRKHLRAGERVSYNGTFTADRDMDIGIIPVGYYECLDRRLSGGRYPVYGRGRSLPILGRVCMNLSVVDLTDTDIVAGDTIEVIGDDMSRPNNFYGMARIAGTIPYECMVRIAESIRRTVV